MSAEEDDKVRGLLVALLLVLAGALLVGAYFLSFPNAAKKPVAAREAGPAVPDFSLEKLDGTRVSLSGLRGKVVVIDFWATWCPPCRAEMPWLVKMGQELEPKGVVFVAISEDDPPDQVPLVKEFAREVPGLEKFAVLGNPEIESAYGVESLPTLFIVDREGRLVKSLVGSAKEEVVVRLVERVASE